MSRNYVKVEALAADVFRRKAVGETNRQIAESYGLTLIQIEQLVNRQNRKKRKLEAGYIPLPKGRPRKDSSTVEARRNNELVQLRMTVDLLRNFLSEAGRR